MSEQLEKGMTLLPGCHYRRLGLCAVYLSLFLTAMFLSALTPCQPHLAGALWVAGRRWRVNHIKQPGWKTLTGLGSNGASLPDADNSGARGPAWNLNPRPGILRGLSGSGASCQSIGAHNQEKTSCRRVEKIQTMTEDREYWISFTFTFEVLHKNIHATLQTPL